MSLQSVAHLERLRAQIAQHVDERLEAIADHLGDAAYRAVQAREITNAVLALYASAGAEAGADRTPPAPAAPAGVAR